MIESDISCLFRLTCTFCKKQIKDVFVSHDKKSDDYLITYVCHGEEDEFTIGGKVVDQHLRDGKMLVSHVFTNFGSGDENSHIWIDGPRSISAKPTEDKDQIAELIWNRRDSDS